MEERGGVEADSARNILHGEGDVGFLIDLPQSVYRQLCYYDVIISQDLKIGQLPVFHILLICSPMSNPLHLTTISPELRQLILVTAGPIIRMRLFSPFSFLLYL